jgi:hypothetical protein
MTKAIIDYQYYSIFAVVNTINKLISTQHEIYNDFSSCVNKIENEIMELKNKYHFSY